MCPVIGITCGYDNTTSRFNLGEDYVRAVQDAGGLPVILPHPGKENIKATLETIDGLILSGGGDMDPFHFGEEPIDANGYIDPNRDNFEILLAQLALNRGLPLLGICRGMQIMNVAAGGKICQDIGVAIDKRLKHQQQAPRWYPTHGIKISKGSLLYNILDKEHIRVNSFHHQIVKCIGKNFIFSATSSDGVVESIEYVERKKFALGVQFHPENMYRMYPKFKKIFIAFVQASLDFCRAKGNDL